jgi:hypothetical protein
MRSALQKSALALTILFSFAAAAWSQCNNPPSPGVVICTPTNGSTVVYLNEVSVRSTPASGASITGFSVYDNKVLIYQSPQGQSGIDLYDGAIHNGSHNLIVKAGDTAGNLYEAKTSFIVTGQGYGDCAPPRSPGINFCNPPAGAVYGIGFTAGVSAKGQAQISKIAFYLNGKFLTSAPGTPTLAVAILLAQESTPYTLRVDALDTSGNAYTATKTVEAAYTYGLYSCGLTCPPGINVVAPPSEAYVGNTFNINMQIVGNPKPITEMKAWIDKTLVATAQGPSLQQEISGAPSGTHILTVQGWDTDGIEYLIQENININVSE